MPEPLPSSPSRTKRVRRPKHSVERRAYKFALEVTPAQSDKLFNVLHLCWETRELLVAEREEDRRLQRTKRTAGEAVHYLTCADQYRRVSALAKADRRYATVHSQVLQNVADRIDEGTKRWLEALREGRPGVRPPHAIQRKAYSGFTYTQYGSSAKVKGGRLHLSKLGEFRLIDHRRMRGKCKTVTLRFDAGRWWAIIAVELQAKDVYRLPESPAVAELPDTGLDTGLEALATLADGTVFDPPRALKNAFSALRSAQRGMSRKFEMRKKLYAAEQAERKAAGQAPLPALSELPYSNRLKAAVKGVAKLHTRVRNVRQHHHRKVSRRIEKTHRLVVVEEHSVQFMLKNRRLARSAADRGIYGFKQTLKAALGPRYRPVPNQRPGIGGNSQSCLCGARVPKELKDRTHHCEACGLEGSRDVVAANIAMLIAFGEAHLSPPAAGPAVVRRGESEGVGTMLHPGRATAAEPSMKRQPLANLKRCTTGGGEPAPAAKTSERAPRGNRSTHRPKNSLQDEATRHAAVAERLAQGSTVL